MAYWPLARRSYGSERVLYWHIRMFSIIPVTQHHKTVKYKILWRYSLSVCYRSDVFLYAGGQFSQTNYAFRIDNPELFSASDRINIPTLHYFTTPVLHCSND